MNPIMPFQEVQPSMKQSWGRINPHENLLAARCVKQKHTRNADQATTNKMLELKNKHKAATTTKVALQNFLTSASQMSS